MTLRMMNSGSTYTGVSDGDAVFGGLTAAGCLHVAGRRHSSQPGYGAGSNRDNRLSPVPDASLLPDPEPPAPHGGGRGSRPRKPLSRAARRPSPTRSAAPSAG